MGNTNTKSKSNNEENYKYPFYQRNPFPKKHLTKQGEQNVNENDEKQKSSPTVQSNAENPGTIDDIHKECKEVIPDFNEGVRFIVNKGLSNNFQMSHQINLKPSGNYSGYRFGVTYVGSNKSKLDSLQSYPIIVGEISSDASLQANIIHKMFDDSIRLRFGIEFIKTNLINTTLLADYFSKSSTFSLCIINPNLKNNSGAIILRYLKSFNNNFKLGFEIGRLYTSSKLTNNYNNYLPLFNAYMRYLPDNNSILSTSIGMSGLQITYFKKCSKQLKFGIELNSNIFDHIINDDTTYTKINYEITLPNYNNFIIRSSIDSNLNICSVLEKKLLPLPLTFSLGALLNHKLNKFRLGCGFILG